MTQIFKVAIAGLGTVGGGVVKVLEKQKGLLFKRVGKEIKIVAVADLNENLVKELALSPEVKYYQDALKMVEETDADLVVELVGGANGIAHQICLKTIEKQKAFVTANKAMIAHHGNELAALCEEKGVFFGFEASVAGGIPIIKSLKEGLVANEVSEIYGILNGTCNYILTQMRKTGASFEDVLLEAQEKGFAEQDPRFDVDGIDTAHKMTILGALAFGIPINLSALHIEGIRFITQTDIAYAEELGFRIKLLGVARRSEEGVSLNVYPCLIPQTSEIAHVNGVFNAVITQSDFLGYAMFVGRGAGEYPTASAVVADIVDAAMGRKRPLLTLKKQDLKSAVVKPLSERYGEYYVRFEVKDKAGVVAEIATLLAQKNVSIDSMIQRDKRQNGAVPVIMTFQKSKESAVVEALEEISNLENVLAKPCMIRLERL